MLTHPFNNNGAKERLLKDYKQYESLVIGLDFDNTVLVNNEIMDPIIDIILRAQRLGMIICLYTCESDINNLTYKFNTLSSYGIHISHINESTLMTGTAKPFFNLLLDDRAGLESAYETLLYVVEYVENNKFN